MLLRCRTRTDPSLQRRGGRKCRTTIRASALARKYWRPLRQSSRKKKPRSRERLRAGAGSRNGTPARFSLAVSPATFVHVILGALALTAGALALLLCDHMLLVNFVVGRVIALPTGVVVAAVFGYVSVLFLGIVESTSTGYTDVDSLQGDWRDWFWTLPSTLGMFAIAAFIGWIFSLVAPVSVWMLIGLSRWFCIRMCSSPRWKQARRSRRFHCRCCNHMLNIRRAGLCCTPCPSP